jgi:hypothetical protein
VQFRRQILEPRRLYCDIVIREGYDITRSLADPGLKCMRLARSRLKQVTEVSRMLTTKVLDYLPSPIARVVVHHQDLPLDRRGKRGGCDAAQCL